MIRIGIPFATFSAGEVIGVRRDLIDFTSLFGEPVLMDQPCQVDALILPGGRDVNPIRYGKKVSRRTWDPDPELEYFDQRILPLYVGQVPIFGICRGFQTLNVHFGGTLTQHIFYHHYSEEANGNDLVDSITTNVNEKFKVNSFHHQGIHKLAGNLTPAAWNQFGRIEAFFNLELKVLGVQWHPERMLDDDKGYYDEWTINKVKSLFGLQ